MKKLLLLALLAGLSLACNRASTPTQSATSNTVTDKTSAASNPTPNPNPKNDKDVQKGYDDQKQADKEKRDNDKRKNDNFDVKISGDTPHRGSKPKNNN